jgi:hypothetical protein
MASIGIGRGPVHVVLSMMVPGGSSNAPPAIGYPCPPIIQRIGHLPCMVAVGKSGQSAEAGDFGWGVGTAAYAPFPSVMGVGFGAGHDPATT